MTSTTIFQVKDLYGLWFQQLFSYDQYGKMGKLASVDKRKVEEGKLRLITM